MAIRAETYSGSGVPSDPYTEARFDQADRDRKAWLDRICKRDQEIARAGRAQAARRAATFKTPKTHARRGDYDRTLCGRTIHTRPGGTPPSLLSPQPGCKNCRDRIEAVARTAAIS